ncbi:hypothetical protein [Algoriphagus hitonicola]|uniref:Sporulation related domain-containing protein n=1 Tax=Algoriphagus hitonicola TaxID=435880 RepID=A0A1I2QWS4_9BACT|nr:hypothetical protein [Algoriphagus hitonicola]SFG30757.1 hypothetical protein SAMN04487988_102400 [Algoriphagus hitonicola]
MKIGWIVLVVIFFGACKSSGPAVDKAASYDNYSEDLSTYLPSYPNYEKRINESEMVDVEASPKVIDDQLNQLAKNEYNKRKSDPYFNGYKVLVYSGLDRDKAFKTMDDLEENFPDIKADIQYQQPRYLVKVGRYAYKVEALKYFNLLKDEFPTARIIQDRILRKEFSAPSQDVDVEGQN